MAIENLEIQPFGGQNTLFYLEKLLKLKDYDFLICSAFIRLSGLLHIQKYLDKIERTRIKFVVGGRNSISSFQAVEFLVDRQFEVVIVDTGSLNRIFHPKIYIAHNQQKAKILLGSGNLTHKGLCNNIESIMFSEIGLTTSSDKKLFANIVDPINKLERKHAKNCHKPTRIEDVRELKENAILVDERIVRPSNLALGKTVKRQKIVPIIDLPSISPIRPKKIDVNLIKETNLTPLEADAGLVLVWSKPNLSRRDLQLPKEGSTTNAASVLSLTKSIHDINPSTHFYKITFGKEKWLSNPDNNKEEARIAVKLVINGVMVAIDENVLISYKASFEAGQGNYTTGLHWGKTFTPFIKHIKFLGSTLELYRRAVGHYEIHLQAN